MKVTSADFITSAFKQKDWPDTKFPEIAFAGRSNVGKSSLINSLLNRKNLVKTSSTPGKTRSINFFTVNGKYMFTDLPGYGYAKGSKAETRSWKPMIEEYLKERTTLRGIVHIVDVRRTPDEMEAMLAEWIGAEQLAHILVVNKCDKLSKSRRSASLRLIRDTLGVEPLPYSVLAGLGRKELWQTIRSLLDA